MAMTPEGRVKNAVRKLLKAREVWHYLPMQNGMGVVGIPDFVCCYKGVFLAIETKAPNKRPTSEEQRWNKATANQQMQITQIRNAGGFAIVADDVSQVAEVLDSIDRMIEGYDDG